MFQVGHHKWVDGNPFVYSEWYDPSKQSSIPKNIEKLTYPNQQPIVDGFSHCTVMFPYHPHENSNWIKIPCDYPIAESSFISKTSSYFDKSIELSTPLASGYIVQNTLR